MLTLFAFTLSLVQGRAWVGTVRQLMVPLTLFGNQKFTSASVTIVIVCINLFLVAVTVILPTYFTKIQNKKELTETLLITHPCDDNFYLFATGCCVH